MRWRIRAASGRLWGISELRRQEETRSMAFTRASGLLLHPTSLPGGHGIGDLGSAAFAFVDRLAAARQQYWQVLPLGPTGYGDSPYQSFSAFAGNPLLIDLTALVEQGWLNEADLKDAPTNDGPVDYGWVFSFKTNMLRRAYTGFKEKASQETRDAFAVFARDQVWLGDYALFAALKDAHGGASWNTWEEPLVTRVPDALAEARRLHQDAIGYYQFVQWVFFDQWTRLKAHANGQDVKIIGDIPIFVAFDSADSWANPHLFYFDQQCAPTVVAGVPPDYFSETGQLWGNPLYRWDGMKQRGYAWWIDRMKQALKLYDVVRVDHFRGFEAYWEVPAGEETAIKGRWVRGPGADLFEALQDALGKDLPIIAEDLGVITPGVEALRDRFELPGMKILQFSFSGPSNAYLPHNFVPNCVVYTGTHDNDTSRGWFNAAPEEEKAYALKYMQTTEEGFTWSLIRAGMASVAKLAVFPVQDLLDLGSEGRMNTPSVASGNWSWRLTEDQLTDAQLDRLKDLTETFGRTPESAETELPHNEEIVVEEA
ncbi:4-alpha-glucanotransferase [compost metagenome]